MGGTWDLQASGDSFDTLAGRVGCLPGLGPARRRRLQRLLLDTFDWRLHAAGLVLEYERGAHAGTLSVRDSTSTTIARQPAGDVPRFRDDLPTGPVRACIAELLDVRALLPRVELDVEQRVYPYLNADDKTVARLTIERARLGANDVASSIRIEPVRGYERATSRLADLLTGELALASPVTPPRFDEYFHAAGVVPGGRRTKFAVALDPDQPPDGAMVRLFANLLATMDANEAGVRDDVDTEFLHDFRVAIRRTRSLLPLARRCMPVDALSPFVAGFREVAAATAAVRDLDVFQLGFDDLATGVAPEWRHDLDKLEPFLAAEREHARGVLLGALDGPWPELRRQWHAFLAAPGADAPSSSAVPPDEPSTATFARLAIRDAHAAVRKSGRRLTAQSPADDVHRLRKRAKVLRYRLEAFATVLPADELREATSELRRLQDVLGEFQDRDVQVHTIRTFTEQLTERGDINADVLLAMGALRAHVRDEREAVRQRCNAAFERFDRPANRERYRALFAPVSAPVSASGRAGPITNSQPADETPLDPAIPAIRREGHR